MSLQFNGKWQFNPITHTQDYLHIPFHETTGTNIEVNGRLNGADFTESFSVSTGTTANLWDSKGYITPAGDNHVSLKSSSNITSLLIPDGKAGMLFQLTVKATRTGSDALDNMIIKVNALGSLGGYELALLNGSNMNLNYKFFYAGEGNANSPSLSISGPIDRAGEDVTLWVYADFTRLNYSISGTRANTSDNVGWDTSSGTLFSSIDNSQDISLLAGHNSGPTPNKFCNAGLATVKFHDLRVWPFYTPPSIPSLYHAVSTYGKYPYEDLER